VTAQAAAAFLAALGIQLDSPHLVGTPRRMARAWTDLLTAPRFEPTVFDNDGYDGLVVVQDIPFHSLCAHHGLPFLGSADVGYVPTAGIVGLSKLAWVVQLFSRRLQVQELLTTQIVDWLEENLSPKAVGVRVRAEHLCMSLRGPGARGAVTTTSALRGALASDPLMRQEWARHLAYRT
jgi:GTP cyclohydrolase I